MNTHDQLVDHEIPADLPSPVALGEVLAPSEGKSPGLLEVLVSLAILVSLAGVTMPLIGEAVLESRQKHAIEDMQRIVDGIRAYSQDTLFLPTGDRGRTDVTWLYGPGIIPDGNNFADGGGARALRDVLLNDSMGGMGWKGPYLPDLQADPWGHAYLVNVDGLIDRTEQAMVLSAGPNGLVETAARSARAGGDDLLLPVN